MRAFYNSYLKKKPVLHTMLPLKVYQIRMRSRFYQMRSMTNRRREAILKITVEEAEGMEEERK